MDALKTNHTLTQFVKRSRSPANASLSVFDCIEGDDNESISWDEFQAFFISTGALDDEDGAQRLTLFYLDCCEPTARFSMLNHPQYMPHNPELGPTGVWRTRKRCVDD